MEAGKGWGGLRVLQRVVSLPYPAARKSRKVVERAQKDTPQPTNESVLSSDSSSGPLWRRDRDLGGQEPATTLSCRHQASPAPAGNSQDNTHRPTPTPNPQAYTQQALNNEHLHVLLCWLSLNGGQAFTDFSALDGKWPTHPWGGDGM